MRKLALFLGTILLLISGCASKTTNPNPNPTPTVAPTQINLSFETNPTKPTPNQPITLIAKVTGNNKPVNDANVELEVWTGKEQHQMLKTKQTGDGVYSITNTYPVGGVYNVVIHATTPQVHQMIAQTFTIGQESAHEHHHDVAGLLLHIQLPEEEKSGQSTPLVGHIMMNNQAFTGANVEFEVWRDNEKHEFAKVKESKPGEYSSTYQFKTPGTYHVKMHVEKGKVHQHTEQSLVVK